MALKNWASNINFHDAKTLHPKSITELAEIVSNSEFVRARGTGHCFNTIADSFHNVVVLDALPKDFKISEDRKSAVVGAGSNYAEIATYLHANELALKNLASLPHISIAGAVATGTHGSGIQNGALHTAVIAVEIMDTNGSTKWINKGEADFYAAVVGLGSTGIAINYKLEVLPTYDIYQIVYGEVPNRAFSENLIEMLSGGYNVSYFTKFDSVGDIWFKSLIAPPKDYFGAMARTAKVHPILSEDPSATTEQLGSYGPWHTRLTHFRIDATPSAGTELQSEFFVDASSASSAFNRIKEIAPEFADKLMISEIRAIAADEHWISPAYARRSVAFHFTWKMDYEIPYLVSLIEEVLMPFEFRPHFGKLFNVESAHLRKVYPKFDSFRDYVQSVDPKGKFRNEFTNTLLELQ